MKESKHTPGPWSYRKWSNHSDQNLLEGFSISSDGRLVPMNTAEGDIYESEANARLISSSPELLEALLIARDHIDMNALKVSHCKDFAKLLAAIAKATGS